MAPPDKRRSSYSRRAQYTLFTGYVLAGIGAVAGAVLLGISLWQPGAFGGPRNAARDAVEPVAQGSAVVRTGSQGAIATVSGYFRAGSRNAELTRELELARIRIAEAETLRGENARLKALLALRDSDAQPVAVSRFIGSTAASTRRFGYIGAGRDQRVAVGMPIVSPRGVVGRVLEVGASTSRVLLLTDRESVMPVRAARSGAAGFAEGRGDGELRIRLLNLGINPLRKGDLFVTSGAGGYYRPGTAVAIVTRVSNDGAFARMVSDPAATDYVAVLPIWQRELVEVATTPVEQAIEAPETGLDRE
jgi:rod shape-determining protein MreC